MSRRVAAVVGFCVAHRPMSLDGLWLSRLVLLHVLPSRPVSTVQAPTLVQPRLRLLHHITVTVTVVSLAYTTYRSSLRYTRAATTSHVARRQPAISMLLFVVNPLVAHARSTAALPAERTAAFARDSTNHSTATSPHSRALPRQPSLAHTARTVTAQPATHTAPHHRG